jgi:ribulose-5-phosphate 4-epimerase/fuculose-1-phosphate aldolase
METASIMTTTTKTGTSSQGTQKFEGRNAVADATREAREHLAGCYRFFARRDMDDSIYTHLSARVPGTDQRYLFIPFGMLFEEVTASNLIEVDIEGRVPDAPETSVNPAAWIVHRVVYEAVPDAHSVMHLHTICGTAVSAQKGGLQPINQFAVTYADKIGYHDYDGPGLRPDEQRTFKADLGNKPMMFLRNHGTLALGRSIPEAFTLMHNLERTCEIQIAAQAGGALAIPAPEIIERTIKTGQGVGDRSFGEVAFKAMLRQMDRHDPSYRS